MGFSDLEAIQADGDADTFNWNRCSGVYGVEPRQIHLRVGLHQVGRQSTEYGIGNQQIPSTAAIITYGTFRHLSEQKKKFIQSRGIFFSDRQLLFFVTQRRCL